METTLGWSQLALMTKDAQAEPSDSDAQMMLRFRAGDLGAFETLFLRHSRAIVNFAYRFVRNREIAEELAQDIFLRVHDAAPMYRAEARFTTWLYRIATNVCLNELRRPRYRMTHQSVDDPEGEPDGRTMELADSRRSGPEIAMKRKEIAGILREALGQLPEKQRMAFVLNKYQGLSYAEVSEILQMSEKAVKSLIHRAKEALAIRLKPMMADLV